MLVLFVGIVFAGYSFGSENAESDLPLTTYINGASNKPIQPSVTLYEENKFEFFYSVESAYKALGSYKIINGKLFLVTDDEKYRFVFTVKNHTLIFDSEKSLLPPDFANVNNQTTFAPNG